MLLRFRSILKGNRFMRNVGSRNILSGALCAICFFTHRRHPFKPVAPSAQYVRLRTGVATTVHSEPTRSHRQVQVKRLRVPTRYGRGNSQCGNRPHSAKPPIKPLSGIAFRPSVSSNGMLPTHEPDPLIGALTMTTTRSPAHSISSNSGNSGSLPGGIIL